MSSERMFELADRLKELRKLNSGPSRKSHLNAQIDEVDYELSELMAETETQNFTRSGIQFRLTTTTRASAAAGKKDELYGLL